MFVNLVFKLEPYIDKEKEDEDLKEGTNKVLITGMGIGYNKFL
jgi:hypothetical protein